MVREDRKLSYSLRLRFLWLILLEFAFHFFFTPNGDFVVIKNM